MSNFDTSLLRERFTIYNLDHSNTQAPVIAVSNRIECRFVNERNGEEEIFIVRGKNIHSCIRMVARMHLSYKNGGFLMKRARAYDWQEAWHPVLNDYERIYNPDRWLCVYHAGKPVFEQGDRHPFVDMIEHVDVANKEGYSLSLKLAESAFKKTGKNVEIEYDGNIAYTLSADANCIRNGITLREAQRTTTFTYQASMMTHERPLSVSLCLFSAAAFLEGFQLSFLVGQNSVKLQNNLIERLSDEHKQTREARKRLERLSAEISNLSDSYKVTYRPERPSFKKLIVSAEKSAQDLLE